MYETEINSFPPELQTSGAVLYAIVRCVSHISDNGAFSDDEKSDAHSLHSLHSNSSHHFTDGTKLKKLQVNGPDATFLSLIQQAGESVTTKKYSSIVEYCDHMGMRMAKSVDLVNGSEGTSDFRMADKTLS